MPRVLARRVSLKFLLAAYVIMWLFIYFLAQISLSLLGEHPGYTAIDKPNRHGSKKELGNDASAIYAMLWTNQDVQRNLTQGESPKVYRSTIRNDAPESYIRLATGIENIHITDANYRINSLPPQWQRNLQQCQSVTCHGDNTPDHAKKYFVTVVVKCRIYETDKAKWTVRELKQWLHYLFLAGVEHVFFCDHFQNDSERLHIALQRYMEAGLLTYIPWSYKNSTDIRKVHLMCYQHVINHYGSMVTWQITIDMDEYPFSVIDTREGFVRRFLENITKSKGSNVTEISMENYLMLGQGNRSRDLVIDRINRMTPRPANNMVKPIYRPERISKAEMHHNYILWGRKIVADSDMLRMAHYWGARTQNWEPDTPETINKTVEMNLVRNSWAEKLRNSLLSWGETDAFATDSGP